MIFVYKKYLPIRLHQFIKEVFVIYGVPLGMITVFGACLMKFVPLGGTVGFLIKGIAIVILYAITILMVIRLGDHAFYDFIKSYVGKRKIE